jgi:uncharacterized heparinase superfamily protein
LGGDLTEEALRSLAVQTRWLARRLEWHLLGNHLFVNAKALVFAGLFFRGPEAEKWLNKGCRILRRQLDEQFLSDGAQFELSPMYHALAFEDLLDLENLAQTYPKSLLASFSEELRQRATAAQNWLMTMSHPDGKISFFNDAAFGIAPSNTELLAYAERLGIPAPAAIPELTHLVATGYVRMHAGQAVAFVDLAKIGPNYLPGHAHADTLSFEFSLGAQRVFVNSGTSEYGTGPERQRQRGTSAHNTVVVAGENSSEVWAGFRVGRRARPLDVKVETLDGVFRVEGSHDGYRHLKGAPRVHRRVELTQTSLKVEDCIVPSYKAEARFHLHPEVLIGELADSGTTLILPNGKLLSLRAEGGDFRLEQSSWHPEFGLSLPNRCLVLPFINGRASLIISWT